MILILCLVGALLAAGLAVFVLFREPRSHANQLFAAGMVLLASECLLVALSVQAVLPGDLLRWQQWRLVVAAMGAVVWLAFCLVYSRANYGSFLNRWRLPLAVLLVLPLAVGAVAPAMLFPGVDTLPGGHVIFVMGLGGFALLLMVVVTAVLGLANLERTLRASVGTMRWRIKLVVLGVGTILGARLYTSSQALLQKSAEIRLEAVNVGAVIFGCLLVGFSLYRTGRFSLDLYPSTTLLHRSLAVLLAGIYLTVVGVIAKVLEWVGGDASGPLERLVILFGLVLLAVLSFSDHVRLVLREMVTRHLRRPSHDYQRIWSEVTTQLSGQASVEAVCQATARWLAATFELLSATVWVADETRGHLSMGASTSISPDTALELDRRQMNLRPALLAMKKATGPVDLEHSPEAWVRLLREIHPTFFPTKGGSRLAVPLVAGEELVGVLSLGDRVGARSWSREDLELLACVAGQTASVLLSLRLSGRLAESREAEAIQTIAAFFAHDLKNTSNTLSLMLQNLQRHFDDPAFRDDALKAIDRSVSRINQLVSQLGVLRGKLEIRPQPTVLPDLVQRVAGELREAHGLPLQVELGPTPVVPVDAEHFEKVLTNLLINAREALPATEGWIRVQTGSRDGWATLTVSDNGCGMPPEFIRKSLFRPFQTTKKKGVGIGMFHVRTIVEAHGGWIEVRSAPGEGSSFCVLLPPAAEGGGRRAEDEARNS